MEKSAPCVWCIGVCWYGIRTWYNNIYGRNIPTVLGTFFFFNHFIYPWITFGNIAAIFRRVPANMV